MKKPKENKFLSGLRKVFNINEETKIATDITDRNYRSISESELKGMMNDVYVRQPNGKPEMHKSQIPGMLDPIARGLKDVRMDHEKLTSIAPEIDQAASILIPSILSPNNLGKNDFQTIIGGGNEDEIVKTNITKLVNSHFGEELDISTKLSRWVYEAMYKFGGKPILILPASTISALRDKIGVTEGLTLRRVVDSLDKELEGSLENFNLKTISDKDVKKIKNDESEVAYRVLSMESVAELVSQQGKAVDAKTNGEKPFSFDKFSKEVAKGYQAIAEKVFTDELVRFSDDPRMVLKPKISEEAALEGVNTKVLKTLGADPTPFYRERGDGITGKMKPEDFKRTGYTDTPYIDLSEFISNNDGDSFPAVIELPYESVIPIIVEGSPANHVGYFLVLNDEGSPTSIEDHLFGDNISGIVGTQRINNLFSAFYGPSQFSLQQRMSDVAKVEILNSVYDTFIDNLMHQKLSKLGLDKHRVAMSSSVSQVMFTRLLRGAKTRVVFVPKNLMVYLAFDYNSDGTGRSKLENIKFPLSLKMTLIITRLISLIESSINRRSLSVTLDDTAGNPLELLRAIKKDIIANKEYGISYDPTTIIKSLAEKELTIIPTKIPGVTDFALSEVANNVEYPKPDDSVLDEIKTMYTAPLGVPPAAMNRLGENEFSRSVASSNIFFSNQLKTYQKDVCAFMTTFMMTYIHFSKKLKISILSVLQSETGMSANVDGRGIQASMEATKIDEGEKEDILAIVKDNKTIKLEDKKVEASSKSSAKKDADPKKTKKEPEEKKLPDDERLRNVVANLKFVLPSPTLAQDTSSFEELKSYVEIVDLVITNMFPDDMVSDPDLGPVVKAMRSTLKRVILQKHIKSNCLLSEMNFDILENVDVVAPIDSAQKVYNLKAGLDALKAGIMKSEGGDTAATTTTDDSASTKW